MPTKTILAALALAAAVSPPAVAQQTIDTRRPAAADGRVEIENLAGSIRVIGWNREEVAVSGSLGRGAEGLDFSGTPHRIRIEVETRGNPHGVRSDLEIHVPAASRIDIESYSGTISVREVTGTVKAESVNGSITVSGASGEVDAQTVGGSVEIDGPATRVRAESVNGSVTVRGASGEVEVDTVNGHLEVAGGTFERAHLETVSGGIRFEGNLTAKAELSAETVSGGVEIVLPASVAADFSVSSFSGDVVNELGPPARRASKYTSEKELEFSTGSGGAQVTAKTLSGEIRLRKR